MIYTENEIRELSDIIVEVVEPHKIILFGSYAYGSPKDDSDVDLLVITNGESLSLNDKAKLATLIYLKKKEKNIRVMYDVFFSNEHDVLQSSGNSGAAYDALSKGEVLYERKYQ